MHKQSSLWCFFYFTLPLAKKAQIVYNKCNIIKGYYAVRVPVIPSHRELRQGESAEFGHGESAAASCPGETKYPGTFSALRNPRGILPEAKWDRDIITFVPLMVRRFFYYISGFSHPQETAAPSYPDQ